MIFRLAKRCETLEYGGWQQIILKAYFTAECRYCYMGKVRMLIVTYRPTKNYIWRVISSSGDYGTIYAILNE